MALKIKTAEGMKKINTNLYKPVIFLDGKKYKLDKAYTFVGGEKKMLWGETGVEISYIRSTGKLAGGYVFAIGENWANVYYNSNVYRLDINNLDNPVLIQSVQWGDVRWFNGFNTTESNMIFDGNVENTVNRLSVNPQTGTISVSFSMQYSSGSCIGMSDNTVYTVVNTPASSPRVGGSTNLIGGSTGLGITWKVTITANNNTIYTVSSSSKSAVYPTNYKGLQINNSSIVGKLSASYLINPSSVDSSVNLGGEAFYSNGLIYNAYSYLDYATPKYKVCIKNPNTFNIVKEIDYDTGTIKMVGINGDHLFLIHLIDNVVKLLVLNKETLSLVLERTLPNDPFNENNGLPTFWERIEYLPQDSKTGFLGVGTYNSSSLDLRIARISALI